MADSSSSSPSSTYADAEAGFDDGIKRPNGVEIELDPSTITSAAADSEDGFDDGIKRPNCEYATRVEIELDPSTITSAAAAEGGGRENLLSLLRSFIAGVISHGDGDPILRRVHSSFVKTAPRLREASANSARDLHHWTRRGGPLRAIFVIAAGTITLLALAGLLAFVFFLSIATINAIIISLLVSLAAAGGFLAIFFACLAAIYVGAVSVAFLIIATVTISTIVAVTIATGWIGFFWLTWIIVKNIFDLTKQSVGVTTSALSAYAASRHVKDDKKSD